MSIADFVSARRVHRRSVPMATPEILQVPRARVFAPRRVRRGEILRKLIHVTPGTLPFLLILLPHTRPLPLHALKMVTLLTAALTLIYIAFKNIVKRPDKSPK